MVACCGVGLQHLRHVAGIGSTQMVLPFVVPSNVEDAHGAWSIGFKGCLCARREPSAKPVDAHPSVGHDVGCLRHHRQTDEHTKPYKKSLCHNQSIYFIYEVNIFLAHVKK